MTTEMRPLKYPRTPYWPTSPNVVPGDRTIASLSRIIGHEVVITEKLDGSNVLLHRGEVYARSVSGGPAQAAPWLSMVRKHHAWKTNTPELGHLTIYGEDIYGIHSIEYGPVSEDRTFYAFASLGPNETFHPFQTTTQIARNKLNVPIVPLVHQGIFKTQSALDTFLKEYLATGKSDLGGELEGLVIRRASSFPATSSTPTSASTSGPTTSRPTSTGPAAGAHADCSTQPPRTLRLQPPNPSPKTQTGATMHPIQYSADDPDLTARIKTNLDVHPYPLLFASVHGSKLYGFDTPGSDRDIYGCHVIPLNQTISLDQGKSVITREDRQKPQISISTHDARKYFLLLLNTNANVLEQILSPLTIFTTPAHEELKTIARNCINQNHAECYLGIAANLLRHKILLKNDPDVKFGLHMYRALLTALHLMRAGELVTHLPTLNTTQNLVHVNDLIARRQENQGRNPMDHRDVSLCQTEHDRLAQEIREAKANSHLRSQPKGRDALNGLLIQIRKSGP